MYRIGINGRYLSIPQTGVGTYFKNILKEWYKLLNDYPEIQLILYTQDKTLKLDHERIDVRFVSSAFDNYYLWFLFDLPRQMKKDGIDCYFTPDYFLSPFLSKKIKKSFVLHDISYVSHPEWFPLKWKLIFDLFSTQQCKKADLVFTVSHYSKKEIVDFNLIPEDKIVVGYNAVGTPVKSDYSEKTLEKYRITSPYFFYFGEIYSRRHVDTLIEAFALLLEERDDIQLVIRGKNLTNPYIDFKRITAELNNKFGGDKILHLPRVSDEELGDIISCAKGLYYISSYEGFGLPVLEAMNYGTPAVTTRLTSLPEVGGEAAIYVDHNSVEEILNSMKQLLNFSQADVNDIRTKMEQQLKLFSWKNTANILLKEITALGKQI